MPLLLIPLGMLIYAFIYPDSQWESTGFEYLFMVIGIPIVMINFMAWFYPDIIQTYFPVKDDWGQKGEQSITFAIMLSTLVAFICVGAGAVSVVASVGARPTAEYSAVQPVTATAFARSVQLLSSATDLGESVIVSTPRPSLEASIIPDETPQIPVSGGIPTSSPIAPTSSSALSVPATQAETASTPAESTSTVTPPGSCTPANPEYVDTLGQEVQDADPENVVVAGWMVQSKEAANLWFIAAKIESDTGTTLLGVWALFVDPEGIYDIYAINDVAMELSYTAWGEDSEPVLTMQSDGAQTAYDCAAHAQ